MTVTMPAALFATIAAASLALTQPAWGQSGDERLGKVHFSTSCKPAGQTQFDRAMLYQHSFSYRASQKAFEEVLKADPDCAIAHWGIALSLLYNPHFPAPTANLALGLAALERGKAMPAKTQRERDYLDALSAMYADHEKVGYPTRVQNYLKAMEQLARRYADDDEAQIHYALALNVAASPADKTYANQLKGAALLEPIFRRQPQHPGVAHYLIHLYDYPPIAAKGLDAAKRYAQIAPDAPHALHMPSHIFTRVGYWKESIASNVASARAAKTSQEAHEQLHAMDYLVYAHLQLAQDKEARQVIDEMLEVKGFNPNVRTGLYAQAASLARYMVERKDWNGAAELVPGATRFAYVDAITHFARALGASRSGKIEATRANIAKLGELRDKLREAKDTYWAEQVDIQWQVATAWLLYAEGKQEEAVKMLRAAADAEDKTEKSIVTPGPLAPARELYGAMLLERGMAKEALAAFEATLAKEPNRLGAYAGAARAAKQSGDLAKAGDYYGKVLELSADADTSRKDVAEARDFIAKRR